MPITSIRPPRVASPGEPPALHSIAPGSPLQQIRGTNPTSVLDGLGFKYTAWGTRHSLGSMTTTALRWLTLSAPARMLGKWIQHGHDSGWQYRLGAFVKSCANVTGAVAGVTGGAVSLAETVVSNLGGAALRVMGAGALLIPAGAVKLAGLASTSADRTGDKLLETAKDLAGNIAFLRKGEQVHVSPELAAEVLPLATLARKAGSSNGSAYVLPRGFEVVDSVEQLPAAVLSKEAGGNGSAAKLHLDVVGHLVSDKWSALKIAVYAKQEPGKPPVYYLSFVGTEPASRTATLKTDVAQALGVEDSAYQDAEAVVGAFVKEYGAANVKLLGHSLGGALAQYAGIAHGVSVTVFNSAGLHPNLRNLLGAERIDKAKVRHFNTQADPLSQWVEGRRSLVLPTAQVGYRYLIPDSGGHVMSGVENGLQAVIDGRTPRAARRPEPAAMSEHQPLLPGRVYMGDLLRVDAARSALQQLKGWGLEPDDLECAVNWLEEGQAAASIYEELREIRPKLKPSDVAVSALQCLAGAANHVRAGKLQLHRAS